MKRNFFGLIFLAMFGLTMYSCDKEEKAPNIPQNGPANENSAFAVRMTDNPGAYAGLEVEITKVEAYLENQGWVTLNSTSQMVMVSDLTNGAEFRLANKTGLNFGSYTRLKITFGDRNTLKLDAEAASAHGSATAALEWDGPREKEIVINERIGASSRASVLLDFSIAQSIIKDESRYILRPHITEITDPKTGIKGDIYGDVRAAIVVSNANNSYSSYSNARGEFLIRNMYPGIYEVVIYPVNSTLHALPDQIRLRNVIIVSGQIVQLGQVSL